MPFALQGGAGVLSPDGVSRFVAVGANNGWSTAIERIDVNGGVVQGLSDVPGGWGVPVVTSYGGDGGGMSEDGKSFVLADTNVNQTYPKTSSSFIVVNTTTLRPGRTIKLKGDFSYDALSPHATRLYLVQHVDANDLSRYVVRAYDLRSGRLLPGRIADHAQKSWVMQGFAVSRATSAGGRWVYTLYQNPGGFPFVHALDTVRGVAHCIGLPWRGNQNGFYNMRLTLRNGDRTLAVQWLSGRRWRVVDTRSWRISADSAGFPWQWVVPAVGATALAGVALLLLRRRRRQEFEQELADLIGLQERHVVV
jgi:MYXO-CTERM domain-containing protein